jgi:hypothetical protein
VGRCRARRLWLFWDKLGVLALGPRTSIAPAHPFAQEDTSDLRTRDLYTPLLCGNGEGIQRPVSFPLLIEGFELSTSAAYQPSGRLRSGQSDDLRAFQLREAWLASGTRTISESVYPFGVEAVEGLSNGFGMAAEFLGYFGGAQSLPTQRDDLGPEGPVSGSMAATSQFVDLPLFFGIFGLAGAKQFRHVHFSFSVSGSATCLCIPSLRNGAVEPPAPMPTRAPTENKWPDDEGRRRVGPTLSPLHHPFATFYLI